MLNSLYFKGEKVFTIELVTCLQTPFFHFPCSARYFPSSIIKLQNNKKYIISNLHLTFRFIKVNTVCTSIKCKQQQDYYYNSC